MKCRKEARLIFRAIFSCGVVGVQLLVANPGFGDEAVGFFRDSPINVDLDQEGESLRDLPPPQSWSIMARAVFFIEIERLGIQVADSEVALANAEQMNNLGITEEVATEIVEKARNTRRALESWIATPGMDREIYRNLAATNGTTEAEWESLKRFHGTKDGLAKFRVPDSASVVLTAGIAGMRDSLLRKKLAEHIGGEEIAIDSERWFEFLKSRNVDVGSEKSNQFRYAFQEEEATRILYPWMAELILNAQIQIHDRMLREALEDQAEKILGLSQGDSVTIGRGDTEEVLGTQQASEDNEEITDGHFVVQSVGVPSQVALVEERPIQSSGNEPPQAIDGETESGYLRLALTASLVVTVFYLLYRLRSRTPIS